MSSGTEWCYSWRTVVRSDTGLTAPGVLAGFQEIGYWTSLGDRLENCSETVGYLHRMLDADALEFLGLLVPGRWGHHSEDVGLRSER